MVLPCQLFNLLSQTFLSHGSRFQLRLEYFALQFTPSPFDVDFGNGTDALRFGCKFCELSLFIDNLIRKVILLELKQLISRMHMLTGKSMHSRQACQAGHGDG